MASWTPIEEAILLHELTTFKTLGEIATRHKRTPNAIHSRLHRIISRSVLEGTPCPVEDIKAFLTKRRCESRQPTLPMMFQWNGKRIVSFNPVIASSTMPPKKQVKVTVIERTVTTKETRTETTAKPKPKTSGACYRCGRTGHWSPDCYARTDVEGYDLE